VRFPPGALPEIRSIERGSSFRGRERGRLGVGVKQQCKHPRALGDGCYSPCPAPMRAERTTLASATTAGGREIAEHLLLADAFPLKRCADLLGQAQGDLAANLDRQLRRIPRQEEPRRGAFARHEGRRGGARDLSVVQSLLSLPDSGKVLI